MVSTSGILQRRVKSLRDALVRTCTALLLILLTLPLWLIIGSTPAHAQAGYADFATISATLGTLPNRLCLADPTRNSELGCPLYAPFVSNTGLIGIGTATPTTALDVSGTISSSMISSNGASLGGLVVVGNSGFSNISATGNVSVTGNVSANRFIGDGSLLTNLPSSGGTVDDRIVSTSANVVAGNGGTISFTTGGVSGTAYLDTTGRLVTPGISTTTNQTSLTTLLTTSWTAINMATAATAPLEVNGNISTTSINANTAAFGGLSAVGNSVLASVSATGNVSVTGNVSANRFIGDGSLLTNLPVSSATIDDRIVSTSANVVAGNGGTISFTTGGVSGTAYLDTTGRLVTPGISTTTNQTSLTTLLTTSWTAINMATAATAPLEVNGNISTTSINANTAAFGGLIIVGNSSFANISATGNVSVTGNVSANRFIGDGSLITGLAPSWYSLANVPTQVQAVSNGTPFTLTGLTLTGTLSSTGIISAATVSSTFLYANQASFTTLSVGGQAITPAGTTDRIVSTSANVVVGNGGTVSLTTGGVSGTAYFDTTGRLVAPGISTTTNQASFTTAYIASRVGIGVTAPTTTLEVSGTISGSTVIGRTGGFGGLTISGDSSFANISATANVSVTGNLSANRVFATGTMSVGNTNTDAALNITGIISGTGLNITGDISYTGVITDISDRRLKNNIAPLNDRAILERIDQLQPVRFTMKNDPTQRHEYGFIAQEVKPLFPNLVMGQATSNTFLSLNYVGLIAPLTSAVQQLHTENKQLKQQLQQLEQRLQKLEQPRRQN